MSFETDTDAIRFRDAGPARAGRRFAPDRRVLGRLLSRGAAAGLTLALACGAIALSPAHAQEQYQAAPPQYGAPPGYPQQQYPQQQYAPPAGYPPQQQYGAPPQYGPPPGYPAPAYAEPAPPPGAVWVGAPGECLYGNGSVYWCAPGVVFSGFPAWWDFGRYPVLGFGAGIVVDPFWFNGWRGGHPGFAFRGRIASEGERRAFVAHHDEIVRNAAAQQRRPAPPAREAHDKRPQ